MGCSDCCFLQPDLVLTFLTEEAGMPGVRVCVSGCRVESTPPSGPAPPWPAGFSLLLAYWAGLCLA